MKIVSTNYCKTEAFAAPEPWLQHIAFYTGILEELARYHRVESIERINYKGRLHKNGVTYHFISQRKRIVRFPFHMHRLIRRLKPDVVLVNGFIFPLQVMQLRFFVGKKVKIFLIHRAEKPFRGIRKWLHLLCEKWVDAYLFASAEFAEQWVSEGLISSRQKTWEIIQATSSFSPEMKPANKQGLFSKGDPVCLWVGRLDPNKDPLTVVRAFCRFLTVRPAARLYMVFQEDQLLPDVQKLVATAGQSANIHLVGQVPHNELQAWYRKADFFLSGSHYEGSGIAVCEAMSCGCIPIITDIPSFRKMTGQGRCGLLYTPENTGELLDCLLSAMELDREKEKAKVLEAFHRELSFEAIATKINNAFLAIR